MANIVTALQNVNGASFIGLDMITDVKLAGGQKNPMLNRIKKHTIGAQAMLMQNKYSNGYANMVRRRLEKEGKDPDSFTLGARAWGTRLENSPIVEHKGAYYLEALFLKPGKSHYTLDGAIIDESEIIGLKEKKSSKTSQGGLEEKVEIRAPKLSSILALRIDGTVYTDLEYID